MKFQVKMVRSVSNDYAAQYMIANKLSFDRCASPDRRRYDVTWGAYPPGSKHHQIGMVFCHGSIWAFVPLYGPEGVWYFGTTRCDAVAGYLQAIGKEVSKNG